MVYQTRKTFFVVVAAAICLAASHSVWALSFAPNRMSTEAFPGVPISQDLQLFNETTDNLRVEVLPAGMQVTDAQKGVGQFVLSEAQRPKWLTIEPTHVVLAPGERASIKVTIALPVGAKGTQYGAIALSSAPARSVVGEGVAIKTVTGPFVFVRALGQVEESTKAVLMRFEEASASSVQSSLPLTLVATIANEGDGHIIPSGEVEVRSLFGRVLATLPLNAEGRIVLPHTVRDIPLSWGGTEVVSAWRRELAGPFGPVSAKVSVFAENGDSVGTATARFFFLPWRTGITVGAIFLGVAVLWRRMRSL